jgi:hypothetical protein
MSTYYDYFTGVGVNLASEADRTITARSYVENVEVLGTPGVARKLTTSNASSINQNLTASVSRISIRAVGADLRFKIGTGTQTADSNSHFIANGERLDFAVPTSANIAVIRDGSTNGTLEVTELI